MKDKNLLCLCGHILDWHQTLMGERCAAFLHTPDGLMGIRCQCLKFKLDNLKLIEDLAKERKLI